MNKPPNRIHIAWSLPMLILTVSAAMADSTSNSAAVTTPATPTIAPAVSPFQLNTTYVGEIWRNNGGAKSGTEYMQGVDAALTIDAQKLFGWPNAQFYFEGFYVGGNSLELNNTHAIAAPSQLDAFTSMNLGRFYQGYYQQTFGGTDVLVGIYDLQQQFATTAPMALFGNKANLVNLALVLSGIPALNGPSIYPYTSLGLRIKQKINDQWSVKFGLLNGESDNPDARATNGIVFDKKYGVLAIGEVDYTPAARTKLMAGLWGATSQYPKMGQFDFKGGVPTQVYTWGNLGGYVGGATRLYSLGGARGVDGFFNIGATNGETNSIARSFEAGMTVTGPFAERPGDKFGAAVSLAQNSEGSKRITQLLGNRFYEYETSFELTYRARLTDWLVVQPEFDYIVHPSLPLPAPNGDPKNALVFGLHFELNKLFQ